jgi:hypothetical protein
MTESDALTAPGAQSGLPPEPQAVVRALTRAAIFLVVTINPGGECRAAVRSFCGDTPRCCAPSFSVISMATSPASW